MFDVLAHDCDDGAARLRVVGADGQIDLEAAEQAVSDLLTAFGRDPASEHLAATPRRVAHAFREMLTPRSFDLTTLPNDEGYQDLVLARDIPFQSLCEHHLLPFRGVAHVGYIPDVRILGLSKLARVVDLFASDLQVQERLTQQVANWLDEHVSPRGSAWWSKPNTCACRSGVSAPTGRAPSPRRCTGCYGTTPDPARSSSR